MMNNWFDNFKFWLHVNAKSILEFFLFLLLFLALSFLFRLFANVFCVIRLKVMCRKRGVPFFVVKAPVFTLLAKKAVVNARIKINDRVYDIAFFPGKTRNRFLVFDHEKCFIEHKKTIYLQSVVGPTVSGAGPNNLQVSLSLSKNIVSYEYESENGKMILINPAPANMAEISGNAMWQVDNSSILEGNYMVYTAKGLIEHIKRI